MSWNQTDRFPHHTFWWEGIDGSRIFTHFPPADTYNAELPGDDLARGVRNFSEHGRPRRRPRVRVGSAAEFFAAAQEEYPDAPVWSGEMYLEFRRGTYTSQAAMKQGNRRTEHLLREAELWCATAALRTGREYPYDQLDSCASRLAAAVSRHPAGHFDRLGAP